MKTLVIGIGREDRGDDAIGLLAVRRLRSRPGLRVIEHGGDGLDLVEAMKGADRLILVDALLGTGPAGRLRRLDASQRALPAPLFSATSSHAFGPAEAVELARTLGSLPREVLLIGVEGRQFATGTTPSAVVLGALSDLTREIEKEIDHARDVVDEGPLEQGERDRRP